MSSFTRNCYLALKGSQELYIPRTHLGTIRLLPKDSVQDRFVIFLTLLTYMDSAGINEWDLFDGTARFNNEKFNQDIDVCMSYINNKQIINNKLKQLVQHFSFEFLSSIREDADYSILPGILKGERPASDFLDMEPVVTINEKLSYTGGVTGNTYVGDADYFIHLPDESIHDILHGLDIKPLTKSLWDYVNLDETNITYFKSKYRNQAMMRKAFMKFELWPQEIGTNQIIKSIMEKAFPDTPDLVPNAKKEVDF